MSICFGRNLGSAAPLGFVMISLISKSRRFTSSKCAAVHTNCIKPNRNKNQASFTQGQVNKYSCLQSKGKNCVDDCGTSVCAFCFFVVFFLFEILHKIQQTTGSWFYANKQGNNKDLSSEGEKVCLCVFV